MCHLCTSQRSINNFHCKCHQWPTLVTDVGTAENKCNSDLQWNKTIVYIIHLSVTVVTTLCHSGYYQLRQIRPVTQSLSTATTETVVFAFSVNPLDYCNSLLYGVTDGLMCRLQSVQNTTARLVTSVQCCIPKRQSCDNSTGCPCDSEYCTRLLSWSSSV